MERYCSNCKFYQHFCWFPYGGYQPRPDEVCMYHSKAHNNAIGEIIFDNISDCLEINKNLNCKNYKRIWYKFWVKGDK